LLVDICEQASVVAIMPMLTPLRAAGAIGHAPLHVSEAQGVCVAEDDELEIVVVAAVTEHPLTVPVMLDVQVNVETVDPPVVKTVGWQSSVT
jgi:hypothetical protein